MLTKDRAINLALFLLLSYQDKHTSHDKVCGEGGIKGAKQCKIPINAQMSCFWYTYKLKCKFYDVIIKADKIFFKKGENK